VKKIISTLIAIAMIISSFGVAVMAEEVNTTVIEGAYTLDNVNVVAIDGPAYTVESGKEATITLVGANTVVGAPGFAGIYVAPGAKLIIEGDGSLNVSGGAAVDTVANSGAGIGGNGVTNDGVNITPASFGSIIINGGVITANGGDKLTDVNGGAGAGIGSGGTDYVSGYYDDGTNYINPVTGSIVINGGTVVANGGNCDLKNTRSGGAGIGTGGCCNGTPGVEMSISITGGNVTATGGDDSAGIGGGSNMHSGVITISGGTVVATGRGWNDNDDTDPFGAAGIGSGSNAYTQGITINGTANVTATAGAASAAIGTGFYGELSANIVIGGDAVVTAIAEPVVSSSGKNYSGAAIGAGASSEVAGYKVVLADKADVTMDSAILPEYEVADGAEVNVEVGEDALKNTIAAAAEDAVIDLGGSNFVVEDTLVINKNLTLKNGTIIGATVDSNGSVNGITPLKVDGAEVTLIDVVLIGGATEGAEVASGPVPGDALHAVNGATVNITGSELVGGDTCGGGQLPGAAVYVNASEVNISDSRLAAGESTHSKFQYSNGVIVVEKDSDSDVSLSNTSLYAFEHRNSMPLVYAYDSYYGFNLYEDEIEMSGTIEVEEGSNPLSDLPNIVIPDGKDVNFIGEVDTDTIKIPTKKITVRFDDHGLNGEGQKNEGKKVYDIMLVADNGKYINELASAEFTFSFVPTSNLGSKGSMSYTIEAIDDMTLVKLGDLYEFNYAGTDVYEGTDTEIKIGTLTVEGYGEFTFSMVGDENIVNATKTEDSIVDTFVTTGVVGAGVLDDSAKLENVKIEVPDRTLEINIDFNNAVAQQVEAYQQMKVEVYGGDLEKTVEINLSEVAQNENAGLAGKDDAAYSVAVSTNKYVVTLTNALTVNTTYNVKVSGAGYRDAYYTVTMKDNKVLYFWNNVKDEKAVMEKGKAPEAELNFLAGDIVKDNIINIYDLSAVVSYFGEVNLVGTNNGYAKYDLNRDGKIDSKDVAYVLVSWNK